MPINDQISDKWNCKTALDIKLKQSGLRNFVHNDTKRTEAACSYTVIGKTSVVNIKETTGLN